MTTQRQVKAWQPVVRAMGMTAAGTAAPVEGVAVMREGGWVWGRGHRGGGRQRQVLGGFCFCCLFSPRTALFASHQALKDNLDVSTGVVSKSDGPYAASWWQFIRL